MKTTDIHTIPTVIGGHISVNKWDKTKTITAKKVENGTGKIPRTKDHKVLIIGESHLRNCAANIKSTIKDNFEVQGIVKPGAGANVLKKSVEKKIRSLTKKDVVVFCGGANDIGRNNSSKALHQIMDFITDNKQTTSNILLISAPHRYDLTLASCVNKEITPFNRKLRKMTKMHQHASTLEMPNVRNLFTNHGLHLNGQGKEKLSNQSCMFTQSWTRI
jgi:hypothetical protein